MQLHFLQVYIGNLVGGLVTEEALRQLFNNTMAAAFPEQVRKSLCFQTVKYGPL